MMNSFWPVITLLFQGVTAGLIVLFVTKRLEKRAKRSRLCNSVILIYVEINSHVSALNSILEHGILPDSTLPVYLPTDTWLDFREKLVDGLSIDDVTKLAAYYGSIDTLNRWFCGSHKEIPEVLLIEMHNVLKAAKYLEGRFRQVTPENFS